MVEEERCFDEQLRLAYGLPPVLPQTPAAPVVSSNELKPS